MIHVDYGFMEKKSDFFSISLAWVSCNEIESPVRLGMNDQTPTLSTHTPLDLTKNSLLQPVRTSGGARKGSWYTSFKGARRGGVAG